MMQSLTARLLLLLFVASGNFAPLVEAISVQHPHACCLRKLHASKDSPLQISDAISPQGNCCPPMTSRHSAQAADCETISAQISVSSVELQPSALEHNIELTSSLSARAPPTFC
jgi:hypothetical protein